MRATELIRSGHASSPVDGVHVHYEIFGSDDAERAIVFSPVGSYIHGRIWKGQVPWFVQCGYRVVCWDGRGSGRSDRPTSGYSPDHFASDLLAVMDAVGVQHAALVGITWAIRWMSLVAIQHPERVTHLVGISSFPTRFDPVEREAGREYFLSDPEPDDQIDWNAVHMRQNYRAVNEFMAHEDFPEPHSTKQIEDFVTWAMGTPPETLVTSILELLEDDPVATYSQIPCPTLLIHGSADTSVPLDVSRSLHDLIPNSTLLVFEGSGHVPIARDPVRTNLAISEFIEGDVSMLGHRTHPQPRVKRWQRAMDRPRRVLFVSSPIGLGHVQRDLAIARELRRIVPDLQVDWLAQEPVTGVLERAGETIHPLSSQLASESTHWEASAGEHRLHCFYAFREMDEILLANFMVFLDAVRETPYDLWIGDEAWEVDHFLHENPELKTAPYVFMTDFLGWLPIDDTAGSREAFLTADYNADMLEHIERFPYIRDRAIYFGEYEDLVPGTFGPGLPDIREWARQHTTAVGYVVPFDPADYRDTRAVRQRLGYDEDQPLIIVAVGGTAVGSHLLDKVTAAWPLIRREHPDVRCVVVAGPRIDPASFPEQPGLEVRSYIHDLYEHLAVADLGIVQGGLGTTMELVVNRCPFLYFPLRDHCEQVVHVAHRLDCYHAGVRMDYDTTTPESLAEAALAALGSDTSHWRTHESGGARRAAALIAEILGK